ncbi:unnamed protein product [Pleuronectes platessa]|uniref:Uncharacterized protein n=1 Tax=Pleuronectes platessa TaxID=8262 RepID=A0A9N7TSM5_PLEPL|nr:unnamed protein product [Pleuronectes platessa]
MRLAGTRVLFLSRKAGRVISELREPFTAEGSHSQGVLGRLLDRAYSARQRRGYLDHSFLSDRRAQLGSAAEPTSLRDLPCLHLTTFISTLPRRAASGVA